MKANLLIIIALVLAICSQLWATPNDKEEKRNFLQSKRNTHLPSTVSLMIDVGKTHRKRIPSSMNAPKSRRRTNLWGIWFIQTQPFMSDFISMMICPIKLSPAKPKIKPGFKAKTRYPSVLTHFIRTSFLTEISSS